MRVVILGNSGSGKSTLARGLAAAHGLAHLDLDTVAWEPGRVAVERDRALAERDVRAFCDAHAAWVVEGCYAGLVRATLERGPLLVLLDPGLEACIAHCRARPFEPHKFASPAEQSRHLDVLLEWVRGYDERAGELGRADHEATFAAYAGPKQRIARAVPGTIAALRTPKSAPGSGPGAAP